MTNGCTHRDIRGLIYPNNGSSGERNGDNGTNAPPYQRMNGCARFWIFKNPTAFGYWGWRSKMPPITQLLGDRDTPSYYTEIENIRVFSNLPDSASEYIFGGAFLLIGTGSCRLEMGDFQTKTRELAPRCAVFISHGLVGGAHGSRDLGAMFPRPIPRRSVISSWGASNMFCCGGINRNRSGFDPCASAENIERWL